MKKTLYYILPFAIVPAFLFSCVWLESIGIVTNLYAVYITLILLSALMGFLSSTNKKFDYLMTLILPISLLLTLFVGLFFDEGCDGTPQLSLHHALNMAYYKPWLPTALIMMIITFIASFKPIRNIAKNIFAKKK